MYPPPPPYGASPPPPQFRYPYGPPPQFGPPGPPQPPHGGPYFLPAPPPKKPMPKALKIFLITVAVIVTVVILAVTTLVGNASRGTDDFEDANAEAEVHHTVAMRINAVADAPPYGYTQEQWDDFWSEPAMNTPEVREPLDMMGDTWDDQLSQTHSEMSTLASGVRDKERRSRVKESLDLIKKTQEGDHLTWGKRSIFEDLTPIFEDACLGMENDQIIYDASGRPVPQISSMDMYVHIVWSNSPYVQEIGDSIEQTYPGMFDAGFKYFCENPAPPLPAGIYTEEDTTFAKAASDETRKQLGYLHDNPNDTEFMLQEEWEAYWELPELNTPEATAFIDRLGERQLKEADAGYEYIQESVDQIKDETLRAHTQNYLNHLKDEMNRVGPRNLGISELYSDLSEFWYASCSSDNYINIGGYTKVDFDLITKEPKPKFNSGTIDTANIGDYEPGDREWSEETVRLAEELYPSLYEAGYGPYCE